MDIYIENAGKRFNRTWIFKNINVNIAAGSCFAILGNNGSGKSTLLKTIAGITELSEGKIHHRNKAEEIAPANWFAHSIYTSPAMELIEEFTLAELLEFHFGVREMDTVKDN